jgi:sugar O-acyltransferase (sialic acid O-acetyltransferase NeuD family)
MHDIGLLGAGGQASEVESYLRPDLSIRFRAVSRQYMDTDSNDQKINLEAPPDHLKNVSVIAAVGLPAIRKEMVTRWPGDSYYTLIADRAYVDSKARIGAGTIIAPMAVITSNVVIGKHALINVGATISHDAQLGDYVTISPGVHIAGKVELGDGVFVGIGATISNDIKIAAGSVIGAGTVVLDNIIDENSVVVGIPGKVIKKNDGWLREL